MQPESGEKAYPIYPSLLAFDFKCLNAQVERVVAAGAAGLHFDVMDGQFVPNLTFGPMVLQALRPLTSVPFWAHLMVYTPEELIDPLAEAGANRLYIHPEATPHVNRVLSLVKEAGMEAGVALNPGTPVSVLEPIIDMVDGILIMSVNPGFGGQSFLSVTYRRLAQVSEMAQRYGVSPSVECDGGVDIPNIGALVAAGMTGAVVGTALFQHDDPAMTLRMLQEAALAG